MKELTIIICSKKGNIDQRLFKNIKETVGCEYELIIINNFENKHSIFEAYNIGLEKSKTAFAVFIHEDILFHSKKWGSLIINYFQMNKNLGLIGVAGSKVRSDVPSAWWDNPKRFLFQNIIHCYPNGEVKHEMKGFSRKDQVEEVSVIDGVFIAMRKDENLKFNDRLTGFHNYDQSISIDFLNKGYKVWVTNEVLIEHFSLGKIDKAWIRSTLDFNKVYRKSLPKEAQEAVITKKDKIYILERFLNNCKNKTIEKDFFWIWMRYLILNPKSKFNKKMVAFYIGKLKLKVIK